MNERQTLLYSKLNELYTTAETVVNGEVEIVVDGQPHLEAACNLAKVRHAFRGAAITLLVYKVVVPEQDVRAHKSEYEGGFSARSYDSVVTIPFLIAKDLSRSVETHWLTQTLSFAATLSRGTQLKTQPRSAGPLLVEVVNFAQELDAAEVEKMIIVILIELIRIRNQDKVIITRPKNLPIDLVRVILQKHFNTGYRTGGPRLPQLAIYAIYQCILPQMARYEGQTLEPLGRMKAADRKAGTVGDVVVLGKGNAPTEAVEIKFDSPISDLHVCEAMAKVRAASVSRYYLLSTAGIVEADEAVIDERKAGFLKQNGCEIIVNGVIETITYYLRLLPSTTDFLSNYAELVEIDPDTAYEHRIAWNEICASI